MRQLLAAVSAACLLFLTACGGAAHPAGSDAIGDDPYFSGPIPALLVNGTLYRWAGVNGGQELTDDGTVLVSWLPTGCEEAGELTVTQDAPAEELQMQAGFAASGTVYTHPEKPWAVYVCMTTDWFEGDYIRFEREG